jgi:hypothetical protein
MAALDEYFFRAEIHPLESNKQLSTLFCSSSYHDYCVTVHTKPGMLSAVKDILMSRVCEPHQSESVPGVV